MGFFSALKAKLTIKFMGELLAEIGSAPASQHGWILTIAIRRRTNQPPAPSCKILRRGQCRAHGSHLHPRASRQAPSTADSDKLLSQKIQGLLRSEELKRLAIVLVQILLHFNPLRRSQPDEHRANRFFRRAPAWPGNSGDGEGKVSTAFGPRTGGHFARNGLTDGAMFRESRFPHAEECLFCFVAVSNESRAKYHRGAGDVCDAIGDIATGT